MSTRWKDKSDIVALAAGDRIPVTDVSDANVDKYFTPAEMATYVGTTYGTTVDNAVARFDGIAGDLQSSGVSIDDSNNLTPAANDGGALGTTALKWSDAFFASGAVVNFNSGDVTITHSANALAIAGASSGYQFQDGPLRPVADDGIALGTATASFSDLFLASGGVTNWNNGDVTITHSSNALAFAGATTNGYSFADGPIKPATNDGAALGVSGTAWSDLFLASGAVINFNAGDVTVTHAANTLTFAGATTNGYQFQDGPIQPVANDGIALGTATVSFADLFLAAGGVINWNNGAVSLTQAAGSLTLAGGGLVLPAGTTALAPLTLVSGTNLTAAAAGAVEYDGEQHYHTIDTSSGRAAIPAEQYFHLTANGGTISTIANFFGANSNISLVANAHYIIDLEMWFSVQTGTQTVTWTLTNSAAPSSQNIDFEMSPATGMIAPPGTATMLRGQIQNDTTATKALTATAALTNGITVYTRMRIWLINGTGTSLKLQATSSANTITPLKGSWWHCRRVSPNNIGTFAA